MPCRGVVNSFILESHMLPGFCGTKELSRVVTEPAIRLSAAVSVQHAPRAETTVLLLLHLQLVAECCFQQRHHAERHPDTSEGGRGCCSGVLLLSISSLAWPQQTWGQHRSSWSSCNQAKAHKRS